MWQKLRYGDPSLLLIGVFVSGAICVTILIFALSWMQGSEFAKAIGLDQVAIRATALRQAAYWTARVLLHHEGNENPERKYGVIQGITRSGTKLVLRVYKTEGMDTIAVRLADTVLADINRYAKAVIDVRDEDAVFDFYGNVPDVVVWIRGQPWNVDLIMSGIMAADGNPPTNIVDKAFAGHYWRIANGR